MDFISTTFMYESFSFAYFFYLPYKEETTKQIRDKNE